MKTQSMKGRDITGLPTFFSFVDFLVILTKSHREVKSFTIDLSTWSPNVYRTMMQSSTRTMGSFLSFILSQVGSGVTHHKEGCAHRCRILIDYLSLNLSLLAKTAIMLYCADVGFPHPPP